MSTHDDASGPIRSAANPRLRRARDLIRSSRSRRELGASVLEGIHLCRAWIDARGEPMEILMPVSSQQDPEIRAMLPQLHQPPVLVDNRLFETLGTMPSPSPIIAIIRTPRDPLPDEIEGDALVLDRVQDPANVGAIIRTAAAAGIRHLLTTPETAYCWAPKVLRAGMGGHFALAIHEFVEWSALDIVLGRTERAAQGGPPRRPLRGLVAHGGRSLFEADLRGPAVWVLGSEGEGLSDEARARLDEGLTIPQEAAVESLNVAASAAICLFEQRRQRLRGR